MPTRKRSKKMKILAIEREIPGITAEQLQEHLETEAKRVWELYQAGVLREFYFRADRQEAVLVLECKSVAETQEILETLPLVQAGLSQAL